MKHVFIGVFLLYAYSIYCQDYIAYQKTFNRIDEDIFSQNLGKANERLDSIYINFDFIYARHCIKALQVAVSSHDSIRANKWLLKSFIQGVPLWLINENKLTQKALEYRMARQTIKKYDSLHALYTSKINTSVCKTIDSLLTIDQKYTWRVNNGFWPLRYTLYYWKWRRNNKKQFRIIDAIIDNYGFPGEKLIGLPAEIQDAGISSKRIAFYGPNIYDHRAQVMLIHYYSNPRKDINEKLMKNVVSGFLPNTQYADFNDFLAREGKGRYGNFVYYNSWHRDPDENNAAEIDKRRLSIGLDTFERQEKNILLRREWRKNSIANAQIIIE